MKKIIVAIGMILGVLFLSLEIYCLKFIQSLEMVHGEWRTNAWDYAKESPCAIALVLTIVVIFFSMITFFRTNKSE